MENQKPITQIGLVVALPTRGKKIAFEWAICFGAQNYPVNLHRWIVPVKGKPIDEARTKIAEFALKEKAKYVWFLDDDVTVPFFGARRLIYDLEQADDDVMVAGGIYPTKEIPAAPLVFKQHGTGPFWKWKKGEVFECSGIGTGCMLVKTEVFTKLSPPWFKTVDIAHTNGQTSSETQTDDLYFCDRVIEAGYKILADGNVLGIHWDYQTDPPTPYALPEDSWPMKEEKEAGLMA
jgi:hypothetical protein